MKIVSFPTIYTTPNGLKLTGDITLFFEFTDEKYVEITTTNFDNVWEVLDFCLGHSENYWNLEAYSKNDKLSPHHIAYEHTTETEINFFSK
jgi:hypothetical protein